MPSETSFVLRRDAKGSVIETHGLFDECLGATGQFHTVNVVGFSNEATVIEVMGDEFALTMVSNKKIGVTE